LRFQDLRVAHCDRRSARLAQRRQRAPRLNLPG
jgi:hypothetical protein